MSVANEISSVTGKVTKTANKVVKIVDKVAGTSILKNVEEYTKKVDNANDGLKYVS